MSEESDRGVFADSQFTTTRWSIVLAAGQRSSPDSRRALESLCTIYWYPLYCYVRRRVGNVDEAHDLTQGFFAELLEKNRVRAAAPDRGRFRAFLLTSFKHYLSKEWAKAKAQKRGGGSSPIPLDFESAELRCRVEPCAGLTPDQLYERQWTVTLLGRVMDQLESELVQSGKGKQFDGLRGFVIGDHSGTSYSAAAAELGMTESAARMAAHRMRRRYRQLLREQIAETVAGPDEIEDEIRQLWATLEK